MTSPRGKLSVTTQRIRRARQRCGGRESWWMGIDTWLCSAITFLTLCVSLEAIFLSAFILISQTYETRLSERRNHLDLQINLLTEQEMTKILSMLKIVADKIGADVGQDPDIKVLEKSTRPDKLAQQIDHAIEAEKEGAV